MTNPHHHEALPVGDLRPTLMPTSGPHVLTTIGRPIRPEAQRAYDAMIQKELRKQRAQRGGILDAGPEGTA